MKTLRTLFLIVCFLFVICSAKSAGNKPPDDHLVPFRRSIYDEIRPSVYKKLFLTSADCGRMLEFPQERNRGESVISVYCPQSQSGEQCQVTLTKATENIGYIRDDSLAKFPTALIAKVRVVRKDASIPRSTALSLRAAWAKMLKNTRPAPPYDSVVLDGEKIEFWLVPEKGDSLKGEIPDRPGKSVFAFVNLGRSLRTYCEAPSSKRATMIADIERQANALKRR